MLPMVPMDPEMPAIAQAKTSTTQVRMAVATSESVCLMPHLAKMDVMPAKNADANAATTHDTGAVPPWIMGLSCEFYGHEDTAPP